MLAMLPRPTFFRLAMTGGFAYGAYYCVDIAVKALNHDNIVHRVPRNVLRYGRGTYENSERSGFHLFAHLLHRPVLQESEEQQPACSRGTP